VIRTMQRMSFISTTVLEVKPFQLSLT